MSSLLRSIPALQSLKSVTQTAIYNGAVRSVKTSFSLNINKLVCTRYFSVKSEWLQEPPQKISLRELLENIDAFGRRNGRISKKSVDEVHSRIKQSSDEVNSTHGLLLLRCCGSLLPEELPQNRTNLVRSIWDTLEKQEVSLDLSHHNALLQIYLENEHDFSPLDFLGRVEQKGLEPNRVTYQRLIARYAQMGEIEGASKVLEFMQEKSLPINESIFNALITCHCRANDPASAVETLQQMRDKGLEPSVDTYATLAIGQAEIGDIDGLNSTIALAQEKEQALHDRDLLEIVFALAIKGYKENIPQITLCIKREMGYNFDCKNTVLRLITAGKDEEARMVYDTMYDSRAPNKNDGAFYVRHLITCGRPLSDILSVTEELSDKNPDLLQMCLKVALETNIELALPLIDAIQSRGGAIRPHYFWPLIMRSADANDADGVFEVMRQMINRNTFVSTPTLVDYALPFLLGHAKIPQTDVIHTMKKHGMVWSNVVNSVTRYYLLRTDFSAALQAVNQHPARLNKGLVSDVAYALSENFAYDEAAAIISRIAASNSNSQEEEDETSDRDERDVVGRFLLDVERRGKSDLLAMLKALESRGMSMSRRNEVVLKKRLGSSVTPEVTALISTLASGTLTMVEDEREPQHYTKHVRDMDISILESNLKNLQQQDRDTKPILIDLLLAYTNHGIVEKAQQTIKSLESNPAFHMGVGLHIKMLGMYCNVGQLQPALDHYNSINAAEPNAVFSYSSILKLFKLLVTENRIDDAVAMLESQNEKKDADTTEEQIRNSRFIEILCEEALASPTKAGEVEKVERLVDSLVSNKFVKPTRLLLSPLIMVHLERDDIDGACKALFECNKKYKVMPMKNELLQELIKREDTERMQQVMDLTTDQFGEASSLLDLAVAFAEQGKAKQAKKILQTPGLRINQGRLDFWFRLYASKDNILNMENLLAATAELTNIDRPALYIHLLQAYKRDGDCSKALGLWTQMQEENLAIPETFMYDLGTFLQEKGQQPPFAVPTQIINTIDDVAQPKPAQLQQQHQQPRAELMSADVQEFVQLLKDQKLDEAVALHKKYSSTETSPLYARHNCDLIAALLHENRVDDAASVAKLSRNINPAQYYRLIIPRRLLHTLATQGNVSAIFSLLGNTRVEKSSVFMRCLCIAYIESNRFEECFEKFNSILNDVGDKKEQLRKFFPKGGFLRLLNKDNTFLPKMEELAQKYHSKGLPEGYSTLWAYHFANNNMDKAKQFEEHLIESGFPTTAICEHVRLNGDVSLFPRYLEQIQSKPQLDKTRSKYMVYDCWIDTLCVQEKPDDALLVLDNLLKHDSSDKLSPQTIRQLKESLNKKNIEIPKSLLEQKEAQRNQRVSSSSSSSNSDDAKK